MEIFGIAETLLSTGRLPSRFNLLDKLTHARAIEQFSFSLEETLVNSVQIVCSPRYGQIGCVVSDNLGEFANQPNVNNCLQKKPRFAPLPVFRVNQCKYSSRFEIGGR